MSRRPLYFLLILTLFSCGEADRFDVDLSEVEEVDIELRRMDKAVFEDSSDPAARHIELMEDYGDFYRLYFEEMLNQGSPDRKKAHEGLRSFVQDPNMKEVQKGVKKVFPELDEEEEELEKALRYYKYHFPDSSYPRRWIAFQGGFSYAIYPTDSVVGFGLEWFLGPDHKVTKRLPPEQFPDYMKEKMKPKYLISEVLKGWVKYQKRDEAREASTVLDHMVFHGKVLVTMDALMPHVPDSVKLKYSEKEMLWAKEYEGRVYEELVDRELFFDSDEKSVKKLTDDAPFTSVLPRESPGRIGQFLGWQMLRNFMEEHPQMPLERLLAIEDAQRIFESYKPPKSY